MKTKQGNRTHYEHYDLFVAPQLGWHGARFFKRHGCQMRWAFSQGFESDVLGIDGPMRLQA